MLRIDVKRESDERWLGEVLELPGVNDLRGDRGRSAEKTAALAFHVIAEGIEHDEPVPINLRDYFLGA